MVSAISPLCPLAPEPCFRLPRIESRRVLRVGTDPRDESSIEVQGRGIGCSLTSSCSPSSVPPNCSVRVFLGARCWGLFSEAGREYCCKETRFLRVQGKAGRCVEDAAFCQSGCASWAQLLIKQMFSMPLSSPGQGSENCCPFIGC